MPAPNPTVPTQGPPPIDRSSRPPNSTTSSTGHSPFISADSLSLSKSPCPSPQLLRGSLPLGPTGEDQNCNSNTTTGTEPRTPHFSRKPGLHSATPHTQRVLKCAQMKYKIALLVKHPFPDHVHVGTKTIMAKECWDEALEECGVQGSIKFTENVEKVVRIWLPLSFSIDSVFYRYIHSAAHSVEVWGRRH